jgi:hypothetical protein
VMNGAMRMSNTVFAFNSLMCCIDAPSVLVGNATRAAVAIY